MVRFVHITIMFSSLFILVESNRRTFNDRPICSTSPDLTGTSLAKEMYTHIVEVTRSSVRTLTTILNQPPHFSGHYPLQSLISHACLLIVGNTTTPSITTPMPHTIQAHTLCPATCLSSNLSNFFRDLKADATETVQVPQDRRIERIQ